MVYLLLFLSVFLGLIFVGTVDTFGYDPDVHVPMFRNSDQKIIFVYADSTEKLDDRGYADEIDHFKSHCQSTPSNCTIKYAENDNACLYVVDLDECIATFERYTNHMDCKKAFKFFADYQLLSPQEELSGLYGNYINFGYGSCDVVPEYGNGTPITSRDDKFMYMMTHHANFVRNNGIVSTMDYSIHGVNETNPPMYWGKGYFESVDTKYTFYFYTIFNNTYLDYLDIDSKTPLQ